MTTRAVSPYRHHDLETLQAENERLKAEIRALNGEDAGIQPFPDALLRDENDPSNDNCVHCPFCTTLWSGRFWLRFNGEKWLRMPNICIGQRYGFLWLRSCKVRTPHRHRKCDNCDKRWIERARAST